MGGRVTLIFLATILTFSQVWGIMNSGRLYPPLSSDDKEDERNTSQTVKDPNVLLDRFITENPSNALLSQGDDYTDPQEGIQLESSGGIHIEQMSSTSNLTGSPGEIIHFIIKNVGKEDEYVHVNVSDEQGYLQEVPPTAFYLPSGSAKEISVRMKYPLAISHGSPDKITISASGKRHTAKRSAYYYPGSEYDYGQQYQPFCYDRYVTGSCRYRMDPYDCDQYKWTAYATIQNSGGIQQLRSIPEGLYIPPEFHPGTRDRLRVYLTVTCCVPIVQFLSVNPYHPNVGSACIVDVRELQGLNPAEIAGIVIGAVILLIIIVVVIALCIRRKRARSILVGHSSPKTSREVASRE